MTITTDNLPALLRRALALKVTGLEDRDFSKAVRAEVIVPVYLVWEVVDKKGKVLCADMSEAKAQAHAEKIPGAKAQPVGRAYFRKAEVLKLVNGKTS